MPSKPVRNADGTFKFRNGTTVNKMRKRKRNGRWMKYLRIVAGPQRGEYVHRLIVAARIGRPLASWETVDHKNGNTLDNDPANLSDPISYEEHARITSEREQQRLERRKNPRGRRDDDRAISKAVDFAFGHNEEKGK